MTNSDLQQELELLGIRRSAYSLEGGVHDDKYVLSQEAMGNWAVYYSERGLIIGNNVFNKESDACEYFMKKLTSDPTTRQRVS
jgi:hypothetical protein